MLDKWIDISISYNTFYIICVFFVVFSLSRQRLLAVETKPRVDVQCSDRVEPQAWES